MNAVERVDAFARRVITEELGGSSYAADAGAIAAVLDRVTELEAALKSVLDMQFNRYACTSERHAVLATARRVLDK